MNHVCSHERLELALAGLLNADEESALSLHLDECELCSGEIERLAGGQRVSQEVAAMLKPDDLDDALPLRSECSSADFVVEQLEPSDDPAVLGRIGGYDVLEVIGHGGMGVVLRGFDRELKRFVAIKALAPHLAYSALARKRFAREAQAAAAVVNLHVIAIHQVQPNGQLPFLVMPLLSGESLAERMKARGMLELKEVLRIGMQAAQGLAAAHSQGLVHRDIKPANILLEKGVDRAVLTDFGLARAADDVSMTRFGVIAGTPEYMSPEQARGEAVDGRSDLFSLGCVLYEMATGVSPFRADSTMATLRRIVDDKPVAMASCAPDLPPWFIGIVDRLLSKDPAQRFASASEVSELLEQCLSHLQRPTAVPLPKAAPTSVSPSGMPPLTRWFIGTAFAFSLVLAGIFIVLEWNKGQITIQCAADDVPVRIRQGETVVKELTVTKSGATVRVAAGEYVVEINGAADGIVVQNGVVSIQRRGVETVRIVSDDAQPRIQSRTERGFMVSGPTTYAVSADAAPIIACTGPKSPTRLGAIVADVNFDNGLDQNIVWLHVWDWSKSDVSRVMLVQKSELGVLAPNGNMMLTTEGEKFNLETRETRQFSGFQVNGDQLITSVRLSPGGKYAAAMIGSRADNEQDRKVAPNSGKWTLRLLELDALTNTGMKIGEFPANANVAVAFSLDERSVTYSSDNHRIIRRETASGNILNEYEPAVRSRNGVVGLTVSPEGRLVAAADYDGNIYVWESRSGKLVVDHSSLSSDDEQDVAFRARVMRFSPEGTYLALAAGSQLQVMETTTGEIIKKHTHEASPQFTQLRWSQDAKSITLLTLFQPTNFVEEHSVSTRPTANIFPRVYEWEWREGNPVLKQFGNALRKPIDRRNARVVAEGYLNLALGGDIAAAASLANGKPADAQTIARQLNLKRLSITSVYVNDPAEPTAALATSKAVKLQEKQPNGEREGFMVVTLTMGDGGWFVTDVDFESEDGATGELKRFLKVHPKATSISATSERAAQSDRDRSVSNVKQIVLAMQRYHAEHHRFPPAVIYGIDGKGEVPHSWRVELLPYLENGDALYREYQFDEPWDSAANQEVLAQMPAVYRHGSAHPKSTDSAYYVVVGAAGDGDAGLTSAFSKKTGLALQDIVDGASYTIAVVETKLVVPWTKPDDVLYDPDQGMPVLGGYYERGVDQDFFNQEGFYVGNFAGSVHFLRASVSEDLLRAYLSPTGGEEVRPMEDAAVSTDRRSTAATATARLPKLPDDEYTRTGIHCQKFREEDAKRPGGEVMGHVMESELGEGPLVLGMRVARDAKWNVGGQARVDLVLRNAGGSDVKFTQTPRADNGLSVLAVDADGKEHQAEIAQFDGLLELNHLLLPRGHIVMVKSFTLRFDPEKRDASEADVAAFHLPPGDYTLRCKWSDARRDVAHEGEWTGELVSVEHKFQLAAAPAASEK
jgi:hypothetical protein